LEGQNDVKAPRRAREGQKERSETRKDKEMERLAVLTPFPEHGKKGRGKAPLRKLKQTGAGHQRASEQWTTGEDETTKRWSVGGGGGCDSKRCRGRTEGGLKGGICRPRRKNQKLGKQ